MIVQLKQIFEVQSYFFYHQDQIQLHLVEELANKAKKNINTFSISQGREEFGEAFIAQSKAKRESVLLHNYHFVHRSMDLSFEMYKPYASGAEKEQNEETKAADANKKKSAEDKAPKQTHEDYRFWITTEAH
jgi:hypothetical protein